MVNCSSYRAMPVEVTQTFMYKQGIKLHKEMAVVPIRKKSHNKGMRTRMDGDEIPEIAGFSAPNLLHGTVAFCFMLHMFPCVYFSL